MDTILKELKLARIRIIYKEYIDKANKENISYYDFLKNLLLEELSAREENRLRRQMRYANFPFEKTVENFNFTLRPEINKKVFLGYLNESFIQEGHCLVFIGPPGLGKTHLSVALGIRMVQLGFTVRFILAQYLVNEYLKEKDPGKSDAFLDPLKRVALLVIDEFGYLPYPEKAGPLFYEIIASRYERNLSTIITSNKALREWGNVLHDSSLAAALVDRLMERGDVYYLSGESYRLRGKEKNLWFPLNQKRENIKEKIKGG
ncbi:MAG TPA: ATP-binding protein [Thermoplasmata archaeon]|nr:ATP-binding protein [Thermoplasmata archaeon]